MAKTKAQKADALAELSSVAKQSESVVFVNFNTLTVADETELRSSLRSNDVSYKVVKKTLLKRAFAEGAFEGEMPELEGMIAIAYGDDKIAPAREVYAFQENHKDQVSIVGGIFEGRYMSQDEMMSIATIPPTPVLYSQLLSMFNSPIQQFVVALNQIAEKKEA
jgi:large subunit ribosomal protein L10